MITETLDSTDYELRQFLGAPTVFSAMTTSTVKSRKRNKLQRQNRKKGRKR